MNLTRVLILCFVPLVWCVSEILSIQVYENMDDDAKNFTIDANPTSNTDPMTPEATQSINLFLPENSQVPTKEPDSNNKTKKTHHYPGHVEKILKSKMDLDTNKDRKKQTWQIPSPLSPLATSDPKTTNSSKRQTEFIGSFVPSQEIGSYDNTEGFVPHAIHEAKSFIQPTYLPPKPLKHDIDINYGYGEPRLPPGAAKGLQNFEHDYESLKAKYPELNDLVNNYPIMEEIMKQKIAEKFQQTYYSQHHLNEHSGEKYKSEDDKEEYDVTIKVHSNSNENFKDFNAIKSHERPYLFESEKKRPTFDHSASTAETPFVVPAGEYYQEPKFPLPEYYEDKNHTIEIKDIPYHAVKPKKPVSPWKKVLHLVTALLPVGLLLTALTPNVITISNVADKNYPIRQRSVDPAVINFLSNQSEDFNSTCDEMKFCLTAQKGSQDGSSAVERILWTLAMSTPDHVAESAGVKRLFGAVKNGQCSIFECNRRNQPEKIERTKKRASSESLRRYKRIEKSRVQ